MKQKTRIRLYHVLFSFTSARDRIDLWFLLINAILRSVLQNNEKKWLNAFDEHLSS